MDKISNTIIPASEMAKKNLTVLGNESHIMAQNPLPQKPKEPGYFERISTDIKNSGEKIHNAITGQEEFQGEKPLQRGFEATAEGANSVLKTGAEALPQPVRKTLGWIGEKIGQGFKLTTDEIAKTKLFKEIGNLEAQGYIKPETAPEFYKLKEALGVTSAGGQIANDIIVADAVAKTPGALKETTKKIINKTKATPPEGGPPGSYEPNMELRKQNAQAMQQMENTDLINQGNKVPTQQEEIDLLNKNKVPEGYLNPENAKAGAANAKVPPQTTGLQDIGRNLAELKYGKDPEKIISAIQKRYEEIPLPKGVMKMEAETGKDFARFMAEKPQYEINVKNMKYDTYDTAQALRQEASVEARAFQKLLESRQETISEKSLISDMQTGVNDIAAGQERNGAYTYIQNEVQALVDQYATKGVTGQNGERLLTVAEANKIKQILWDRSPFNPTASRADRLRSSLDYKMGQTIRRSIEQAVPDADIHGLNAELGNYYNAIETLENLHGSAAKGGRLGIGGAKITGAIAGTPGGLIGSLVGYFAADKVAQWFMSPANTTRIQRYVLQELEATRPSVAQKVMQILDKQDSDAAARLKLPEAGSPGSERNPHQMPNTQGTNPMDFSGNGQVGGMRQNMSPDMTPRDLYPGEVPLLPGSSRAPESDVIRLPGATTYESQAQKAMTTRTNKSGDVYQTDLKTGKKTIIPKKKN